MTEGTQATESPTAFLDEREGALFPGIKWLTPRRLAFFLVFWISVFFAGSLFINNPFTGSSGAANWDIGAGSSNYYWVVMYLHGLNTGLVGLAALIACDFFALPSLRVRRGIAGGVLVAGVLSPLGAIFNTSAPWTSAGLWIQVVAFLALDEIVILLLWGMLELWRSGAPRSRTLPFVTTALTGVTMLFAALLGHLAGTILGFGNNPPVLGWYATNELGGSLNDFAAGLIGAHSYLMISAVPAGVVALVAQRFGYFKLEGRLKQFAQLGFALVCLDLILQMGMALMGSFGVWPGDLPPEVMAMPGVPAFLAVNDLVDFVFLVLGSVLVLGPLVLASGRLERLRIPAGLPLRALPLLMLGIFTILTTITEPTGDSAVGTPPQAWLRLFVAFYLTMVTALVILLAERLLGAQHKLRIGWTLVAGSLLTFVGVTAYISYGLPAGGYIAAAGLLVIGSSFVSTAWWGLSSEAAPVAPAAESSGTVSRPMAAARLRRATLALFVTLGVSALLVVAAAGAYETQSASTAQPPPGGSAVAVEYINASVQPGVAGGHAMFDPGNFTVMNDTLVIFTFVVYDTNASLGTPDASTVVGTTDGAEELIPYPGAAPENVTGIASPELSHTFTIQMNGTIINIPLEVAASPGQPATVVASVVFTQTGTFIWYCDPDCESTPAQPGDGMAGIVTVA